MPKGPLPRKFVTLTVTKALSPSIFVRFSEIRSYRRPAAGPPVLEKN